MMALPCEANKSAFRNPPANTLVPRQHVDPVLLDCGGKLRVKPQQTSAAVCQQALYCSQRTSLTPAVGL